MKIMPFVFLFLLFNYFTQAQSENAVQQEKVFGVDTILWQAEKFLSRFDFKAKPTGSFHGLTYSGIAMEMNPGVNLLTVKCYALFFCKKSFLKDTSQNLLNHEQLHFDITELYARKIRQQLSQKLTLDEKNISAVIQKIYNQQIEALNKTQNLYDKETAHSTIAAKQQQWIASIRKQLNLLENYTYLEVDID